MNIRPNRGWSKGGPEVIDISLSIRALLRKLLKESLETSIDMDTHSLILVVLTIDREKDLQCRTKTKNLKLSPEATLLTSDTIHQGTARYTQHNK